MEKKLVKTWLYTFFIMLSLCIIFVRDSYRIDISSTGYSTYTVPLRDYILEILRWSLAVSLLVTAIVALRFVIHFYRRNHS